MRFIKTNECGPVWYSDKFKIVLYAEDSENKYRPTYRAYFKPDGWKNFGNRVNRAIPFYHTFAEALTACKSFDPLQANHY